MLEFTAFHAELTRIEKNIIPITVGAYSGFTHSTQTPSHAFVTVDLFVPELGFLHIVARDSFTPAFLEQLVAAFDRVRKKRYEAVLHVYGTYDLDGFGTLGIAPPALAKAYESRSSILAQHGFQVFPMHGIEFLNGFSAEQFWAQRRRKDQWNVCILDWKRRIQVTREGPNKTPLPTPVERPPSNHSQLPGAADL
jgi:hypothetical protein